MDFLDPKRRKQHRQRLLLGYLLISVAIAMATLILLFLAYGYDVDRKTGNVIQNGIVFLGSRPSGAAIYINGQQHQDRTETRMVLPGGQYPIRLELDKYRVWERTISLDSGQIERIVYPFLIPLELKTADVQLYASMPVLSTQSPDRRWVLVQQPAQPYAFDLYDTTSPNNSPSVITVPAEILTNPAAVSALTVVEWSNDNRHVLLQRSFEGRNEFVIFDRERPVESVNINKLFGIDPTKAVLRDKKFDQLYLYEGATGTIRSADVRNKVISAPLVQNAIAFKGYGTDLLLYVTAEGATEGKIIYRINENGNSYTLRSAPKGLHYVLDIAEYDNTPLFAIGSDVEGTVYLYNDPLSALKAQVKRPFSVNVLKLENLRYGSFSANTQYFLVQSGNQTLTFDAEHKRLFRHTLPHKLEPEQKLQWIDGHRLSFIIDGVVRMIDFDGSNEQKLVPAAGSGGIFFDRDYENLFALSPSVSVPSRSALTRTSMKVE